MDRKKAKRILVGYKILKYLIGILDVFLAFIVIGLIFELNLPFFPFLFLWCIFLFGGYSLILKFFFHKSLYLCSFNSRLCIKYNLLPLFIVSLFVCAIYWKHSVALAWIIFSRFFQGLVN